jgi:hypothetical protein
VRAGEGLTGLTVPVLEAGAASVAATLWPVSDAAVEPMIELFYRELARGATVGDAMNRAKRAARAAGVTPAVWAAFTLTGDPRVRAGLREPRLAANRLALPIAAVGLALAYYGLRTTRRRKLDAR